MKKTPEHIAIIMDGNGRWANKRNLPRVVGHQNGTKMVDIIAEACARKGVKALTLYSFSTENWKREKKEVDFLMKLLESSLKKHISKIKDNNIKFNVIGRMAALPSFLKDMLDEAMRETADNTGMILTLAINYGGRQEIVDAAREMCKKVADKGVDPETLDEKDFEEHIYTAGLPDPDLIIRTSGEMRVSNFLLWQGAYSEFYVTDTLWPDFGEKELEKALEEYANRERRFGG